MGQFSFNCAVCTHEILHGNIQGYTAFTHAVVLWENGDRITGEYDGYGRVGEMELTDDLMNGEASILHKPCYKKGMEYSELPHPSGRARNQGFWPGEAKALEYYGEPNQAELAVDREYICYLCNHAWKAKWSYGRCIFGCERPADKNSPYSAEGDAFVEPFYMNQIGMANGLAICWNTEYETRYRPKPEKINCFYYGLKQQIVTDPTKGAYWEEGMNKALNCPGCHSADHLEIVKVLRSPLEMLANE